MSNLNFELIVFGSYRTLTDRKFYAKSIFRESVNATKNFGYNKSEFYEKCLDKIHDFRQDDDLNRTLGIITVSEEDIIEENPLIYQNDEYPIYYSDLSIMEKEILRAKNCDNIEELVNKEHYLDTDKTRKGDSKLKKVNSPNHIIIACFFNNMIEKYEKDLVSESELSDLVNWTTYYFDNNLSLPDIKTPVKFLPYGSKGYVFHIFFTLFDRLSTKRIPRPDSLFDLIKKCFSQFSDNGIVNMRKVTKPSYFNINAKKSNCFSS